MGTKPRLAIAAAVVLLALLAWRSGFLPFLKGGASDPSPAPVPEAASVGDEGSSLAKSAKLAGRSGAARAGSADPGDPSGATELAEAATGGDITVVGRVVDGSLRPVEGAVVRASSPGREVVAVTTDGQGRYRAPIGRPPLEATLVGLAAIGALGTGATDAVRLMLPVPRTFDAGVLVLRPASTLRVRIVAGGKPAPGATVYASSTAPHAMQPWFGSRGEPWCGWSARATADADGVAELAGLPNGLVRLLAVAEGPRRGEARLRTPLTEGQDVEVTLAPARDVAVEVVEAQTRAPLAGVHLAVYEEDGMPCDDPFVVPATDERGRTLLHAVPLDAAYGINAKGSGWCWPYGQSTAGAIPRRATNFRLEVPPEQAFRWPVAAGDGPHPTDGSRLLVRSVSRWSDGFGANSEGNINEGFAVIRVRQPGNQGLLATLDDGRVARLVLRHEGGRWMNPGEPVAFRRPRTLEALVVDEHGAPAPGVVLQIVRSGGARVGEGILTDVAGVARAEGLPAERIDLWPEPNPSLVDRFRWGVLTEESVSVDLREGDGHARVVVGSVREAALRVRAEGILGLPPDLLVVVTVRPSGLDWHTPSDAAFDERSGEVRFSARPPAGTSALMAIVQAPGFTQAAARFALDPTGKRLVADANLRRAAALRSHVTPPADRGAWTVLPEVQVGGGWESLDSVETIQCIQPTDVLYDRLAPGRYRLHDSATGRFSETVELSAGASPVTVSLDLSRASYASGVLDLPDGASPDDASVEIEGSGVDGSDGPELPPRRLVTHGQDFRVRIPGDRPVTLRITHPECMGVHGSDTVTVTGPTKDLRLRLVRR